jgi:hypothetical protein
VSYMLKCLPPITCFKKKKFVFGLMSCMNIISCNCRRSKLSDTKAVTPCSPVKVKWRFRRTCCLCLQSWNRTFIAACFRLVSCLAYSSTLKTEATFSS